MPEKRLNTFIPISLRTNISKIVTVKIIQTVYIILDENVDLNQMKAIKNIHVSYMVLQTVYF